MSVHLCPGAIRRLPEAEPDPARPALAELILETAQALHRVGAIDDTTLLAHRVPTAELALGKRLDSLDPRNLGFRTVEDLAEEVAAPVEEVERALEGPLLRRLRPNVTLRVVERGAAGWRLLTLYSPDVVEPLRARLAVPRLNAS